MSRLNTCRVLDRPAESNCDVFAKIIGEVTEVGQAEGKERAPQQDVLIIENLVGKVGTGVLVLSMMPSWG